MAKVVVVKTQRYPTDLTDSQWNIIKEMIPPAKSGGRPRSLDMRMVINALIYITVSGVQWRMLPKEYPKWQSVYYYFRNWRKDGTWQRIHDTLRALLRRRKGRHKHPTAGSIDSQTVKTGVTPQGVRGFDGGKLTTGRKRHLLVDTGGLLLSVDGAYRGSLIDWVAQRFRFRLQPVLRPDDQKGFAILPRRWVVERTFAWLSLHRRHVRDYERLPASSEAFIHIAMIRIMLRRLA